MQERRTPRGCQPLLLTIACLSVTAGAALAADLDGLLTAIRDYETGQSTAGLYRLDRALAQADRAAAEAALIRALQGPATARARAYVCAQLGLYGSPKAVPALTSLLEGDATFDAALGAFERIGGDAADAALLRRLDAETETARRAALVTTLGRHRCVALAGRLPGLVAAGEPVASAALHAVGSVGTSAAAVALESLLGALEGTQRVVAVDAYLICAERLAQDGERARALACYGRLADPAWPAAVRVAALRGTVTLQPDRAGALVLAALGGSDPACREAAVSLARTVGGRKMTGALAASLADLDAGGQVQVLAALAARGDRVAAGAVRSLATADAPAVRIAAFQALASLGGVPSVALLAEAASRSPGGGEARAARQALAALRGAGVDDAILSRIGQARGALRVTLIDAAAERHLRAAVPVLLAALRDTDPGVQRAAAAALAAVAEPGDLAALLDALAAASEEAPRRRCETVVARVANKRSQGRAREILARLEGEPEAAVVASLLRVAGRTGDPQALPTLRRAVHAADKDRRDAAVRSLAAWPDAACLEDLRALARTAESRTHRVLCLRGYLRLLGDLGGQSDAAMTRHYEQAVSLVTDANGKRLLLSALSEHHSLPAFRAAADFLEDATVRVEAQLAVVRIGGALAGTYAAQVAPVVRRVLAGTANEAVRRQGRAVLDQIERLGAYVTAWQVAGPYQGQSDLFTFAFPPERDAADVAWRLMPMGFDRERPWVIKLERFPGPGTNRVAYLRTRIHSPRACAARLELGSDDGVKVWLNGELVHSNNASRPLVPNQDRADVSLRAGDNVLLLKVTQSGGGWEACLRVLDREGQRLPDLVYGLVE